MISLLIRAPRRILTACESFKQFRQLQSTKVLPYKQDLPPVGGYAKFDWERIPQKPYLSANIQFLIAICVMIYGTWAFGKSKHQFLTEKLEQLDSKIALQPLVMAERDRLFLRRIRRNFEAEEELMKDVPGWEVGKWYDTPVYKTLPKDMWVDPLPFDLWMHADRWEYEKWFHWWWWV